MAIKDPANIEAREAYARLVHLLAESAFDATDEEIAEEMVELGEDLDENAERLRTKMLAAAERGRKHRLKADGWRRALGFDRSPGRYPRGSVEVRDPLKTFALGAAEHVKCEAELPSVFTPQPAVFKIDHFSKQ